MTKNKSSRSTSKIKPGIYLNSTALAFINQADKVVSLLREIFYSIEDQKVVGYWGEHGLLYELSDEQREMLRGAGHDLYCRLRGLLPDHRRDRIREKLNEAVQLILSWREDPYELRTPERAHREQEIIQTASTVILEAIQGLIEQAKAERTLDEDEGKIKSDSNKTPTKLVDFMKKYCQSEQCDIDSKKEILLKANRQGKIS